MDELDPSVDPESAPAVGAPDAAAPVGGDNGQSAESTPGEGAEGPRGQGSEGRAGPLDKVGGAPPVEGDPPPAQPPLRDLVAHHVDGEADRVLVTTTARLASGAVPGAYMMLSLSSEPSPPVMLVFPTHGPQFNTSDEALLAVVADRLQHFQRGTGRCEANRQALEFVLAALTGLKGRTYMRLQQSDNVKRGEGDKGAQPEP